MRLTRAFFVILPLLVGCGGSVTVVLKTPVNDKCTAAGLDGCPEMAEGVLLYVGGDEAKGKDMVVKGAAANTPAKVKKFAKYIKQLKKIPGASAYVAKLVEIADIMLASSKGKAGVAVGPGGPGGPADPDADDDEVRPPPGPPPPPPPGRR